MNIDRFNWVYRKCHFKLIYRGWTDEFCRSLFCVYRERFPPSEFATELRQAQASKWAFRSVADGIDHFKAGRHTEAFQCLNKALTVDPKNVEGLVARGAL